MGVRVPPSANIEEHAKIAIYPVFLSGYPCRHACAYCNAAGASGVFETSAPKEIASAVRKWAAGSAKMRREVALYGNDPASMPRQLFEDLIHALGECVAEGRIQGIRISVRPDTVFALAEMLPGSIKTIELGVPSLDSGVLRAIRRGHSPGIVSQAISFLRKYGDIRIGIQTMLGLPGADPAEALETAARICKMKPDFVRVHPTLVLKSTHLEQMFRQGDYAPLSLEEAVLLTADVVRMYRRAGIPVTRIGFHIPEKLRHEILVAGPFHPAFGELVISELCYLELSQVMQRHPEARRIIVPRKMLSRYIGHGKRNVDRLRARYGSDLKIAGADVSSVTVLKEER